MKSVVVVQAPIAMILGMLFMMALLCAQQSSVVMVSAFHPSLPRGRATTTTITTTALDMASSAPEKKQRKQRKERYIPKWKKKKTLAETMGTSSTAKPDAVGLKGSVSVVFKQGNATCTTMAMPGQPLRDIASQAGQFIQYGCGKGECGTCEALVNGQWVRPCVAQLPAVAAGEDYVIQVKETKAKTVSSGKFYSARSFILGFWNNFLGMVGMVRSRRAAKNNWEGRKEYEDLIMQKTLEKKRQRMAAEQQNKK